MEVEQSNTEEQTTKSEVPLMKYFVELETEFHRAISGEQELTKAVNQLKSNLNEKNESLNILARAKEKTLEENQKIQREFEASRAEFDRIKNDWQSKFEKLTENFFQKDLEFVEVQKTKSQLESSLEELKRIVASQKETLKANEEALAKHEAQTAELLIERQDLIKKLEPMQKVVREVTTEKSEMFEKIKTLEANIRKEMAKVSDLTSSQSRTEHELKATKTTLAEYDIKLKTAYLDLSTARTKLEDSQLANTVQFNDANKKFTQERNRLNQIIQANSAAAAEEISELKQKIDLIYKTESALHVQMGELQTENMRVSEKNLDLQLRIDEVMQQKSNFESEISLSRIKVTELTHQLESARGLLVELKDQLANSQTHVENLQRQIGTFQMATSDANIELSETRAQLSDVQSQNEMLVKKNSQHESEIRELKEVSNKRDMQLHQYCQFMNQEKAKYQQIVMRLGKDVHMAVTVHPLKDYLNVTERELSRIECELKKTPVISPNRETLEKTVDQLIEQRDMIRSLIAKSEASLSKHAASLQSAMNGALGAPFPPSVD